MTCFELLDQRRIAAIEATAQIYRHAPTGARHLHLATDEAELGFLVGFPSLPDTDDGRAHILEHTVLCGSERYPVRDPFFAMLQRSVATFMNAMTFDDRTVYPFSTTDATDFDNLLDVYLDAVFFPRLDRLDFLQEGWRAELQEGRYTVQGVVFNEMKSSYDDPDRVLYLGVMRALFGGTPYGVDSGGDPLCIPSLKHDALRRFHAAHYHPSQAVFMTSGSMDVQRLQARLEERVLSRFDSTASRRQPALAGPWRDTRRVAVRIPAAGGGDAQAHGLQLAWRFDAPSTVDDKLRLEALMQCLAGHDGSPLPQAIRALGFGRPSPLMGFDPSPRQPVVHVGVASLRADQLEAAHAALSDALQAVARQGMAVNAVEGVLRRLRYGHRRQVPGLHRLIEVVDAGLRDEDVLEALDRESSLARLAHRMRQPGSVQQEVARLLACTNHLVAHVQPDDEFAAQRILSEQQMLDDLAGALTVESRQALLDDAAALQAHQRQPGPGVDVLPRIAPSQLSRQPRALRHVEPDAQGVASLALATHGVSHAEIAVDVSAFALDEAHWLDLLVTLWSHLGAGGQPAAEALAWRESQVQEFSVAMQARIATDGQLQVELSLSADALSEHQDGLAPVLAAWFASPDLSDPDDLGQRVRRTIQERAAGLIEAAPDMAQWALQAPLQPDVEFKSRTQGLPSLRFLADLQRLLVSSDGRHSIRLELQRVLDRVQAAPRCWLCAAPGERVEALAAQVCAALAPAGWNAPRGRRVAPVAGGADDGAALLALRVPSQVNACAMAWPVPTQNMPEGPALAVGAQLLTQQFLHPAVRERGGAYDVRAVYDGFAGTFSIQSAADPRLAGTFADFLDSLEDVQRQDVSREALENAILGVIKVLDRPALPLEQLREGWEAWRLGVSVQDRERFRTAVLDCTLAEVRRVLRSRLNPALARRAASVGMHEDDLDGLQAVDLMQLAAEAGLVDVDSEAD